MYKTSRDTDKNYTETKIGNVAGSDGGAGGWELREGPSQEVAFKRQQGASHGDMGGREGHTWPGCNSGNGPEVGTSLECSRKRQKAS